MFCPDPGAIWGGLLPTVIAIGFYFCFADAVMLAQVFYYDRVAKREKKKDEQWKNNNPAQPLLPASRRSSVVERRRSHARRRDSLSAILVEEPTRSTLFIRNSLSIVGVCVAGVLGWGFAWWAGAWKGQENGSGDSNMPLGAQILGYLSTVLYLTARIPQIIRNHQKKSCEGKLTFRQSGITVSNNSTGLSLLFFCLSMLGNLTYGAGVSLAHNLVGSTTDHL